MIKKLFLIAVLLSFATSCFAASTGNVPKRIIFKGINTKAGPLSLDEGESPDCMNVHTSLFGTLVRRNGYTEKTITHQHITTATGNFNGLYNFVVNPTTSKLVAQIDANMYKMDALDGVFDPIVPLHTGVTVITDDITSFENFEGTLIFTTWSRDYGRQWNGITSTYSHVQLMPRGKYIMKAYNRLFVQDVTVSSTGYGGSSTDYPLRFYYSSVGSFTDWGDGYLYSVYDDSANYETLDAPAGDVGMGWGFCRGNLYGFSNNSVSLINNEGGGNPIVPYRRLDGIGCGAPRSIKTVSVPSVGEVMIWLTSDRKIAMWSGGGAVKYISDKIDSSNNISPVSVPDIHPTQYKYAHAQVYEKEGWYVLWFPTVEDSTINMGLLYDYRTDTLWPINRQKFLSSASVDTSSGNDIYCGDYSGNLYKWDDGNSDDGNTINSYWTSRRWDFGWYPLLKKGKEVQITTKTIGNYYLKYEERYDWDSSWNNTQHILMTPSGGWLIGDLLPALLGTYGANTAKYDIGNAFNLYQIKLSNNTTNPKYEVYSLDTLVSTTGIVGE